MMERHTSNEGNLKSGDDWAPEPLKLNRRKSLVKHVNHDDPRSGGNNNQCEMFEVSDESGFLCSIIDIVRVNPNFIT